MKQLKRLTLKQKQFLSKSDINHQEYLAERNPPCGVMFVDRFKTHGLYYCREEEKFYRLEV